MAKEAYYFSHDSNARRDPKILAMRNEFGNEGYGRYWLLVEMLSEQEDYKLKHAKWVTNAIAMELLCDTNAAESFVNSCIEDYELFVSDGEHFWSESLLRRMNLKEEKRLKKVEAGRKGAKSRWNNSNGISTTKQTDSTAIAKHGKGKESKVKESKAKEKVIKEKYLEFVFLKPDEYERLVADYGKKIVDSKIEDLDNYIGSKGVKYVDHNRTLRGWLKKDYPNGAPKNKEGSSSNEYKSNSIDASEYLKEIGYGGR